MGLHPVRCNLAGCPTDAHRWRLEPCAGQCHRAQADVRSQVRSLALALELERNRTRACLSETQTVRQVGRTAALRSGRHHPTPRARIAGKLYLDASGWVACISLRLSVPCLPHEPERYRSGHETFECVRPPPGCRARSCTPRARSSGHPCSCASHGRPSHRRYRHCGFRR